jgi:hypothetical protein
MTQFDQLLTLLEKQTEITNLLPIDAIRERAEETDVVVFENERHLIIQPQSHQAACNYGQYSRSRFCIANPNDDSDWNMFEQLRTQHNLDPKFYFIFDKTMSTKNKKTVSGVVVYPASMSAQALQMGDDAIIENGKKRFRDEVGGEINYSDEYLKEWVSQIRKYGRLFEAYNSNNRIILPDELSILLGEGVFREYIVGG